MTTPGFQACPTTSTTYTVTVTDAAGCSVVAHTRVCVIDVRCGNKLDKVLVCHCPPGNPDKCKTLCLTKSEVHSHLHHGDLLGPCGIDHSCTDQKADLIPDLSAISEEDPGIEAYPNPFTHSSVISFPVNETGKVVVCLSNHMGQTVSTVFEGDLEEGDDYQFEINAGDLQPEILNGRKLPKYMQMLVIPRLQDLFYAFCFRLILVLSVDPQIIHETYTE